MVLYDQRRTALTNDAMNDLSILAGNFDPEKSYSQTVLAGNYDPTKSYS